MVEEVHNTYEGDAMVVDYDVEEEEEEDEDEEFRQALEKAKATAERLAERGHHH